jgi:hypothetical protein
VASNDSWAGWIAFAGIVLLIVGSIDMIQGLFLIFDDDYVVGSGEAADFIDASAWGWIALLWGGVLFLAGLGLFKASEWARWVAIIGGSLGALAQFAYMANYPQAYPLWNVTILTLYIVVIYALVAKWEGFKQETMM